MSPADKTSRRRADIVNAQSLLILRTLADATVSLAVDEGAEAAGLMVIAGLTATLGLVRTAEINWGVQFDRDALRAEFERTMALETRIYERGHDGAPGQPNIIQ